MKQTNKRQTRQTQNRSYKIPFKERKAAEANKIVKNFAGKSIAILSVFGLYLIITSIFFMFFIWVLISFISILFKDFEVNQNYILYSTLLASCFASFETLQRIKKIK
jgi:uncharacterized membrane protein